MYQNVGMTVSLNFQELKIEKGFRLCNCYIVLPSFGTLHLQNSHWKALPLQFSVFIFLVVLSLGFCMCKWYNQLLNPSHNFISWFPWSPKVNTGVFSSERLFHNPRLEVWPILLTPPKVPRCLTKGLGRHFWQLVLSLASCRAFKTSTGIPLVPPQQCRGAAEAHNTSQAPAEWWLCPLLWLAGAAEVHNPPWAEVLLLWLDGGGVDFSHKFFSSCSNQQDLHKGGSFSHA